MSDYGNNINKRMKLVPDDECWELEEEFKKRILPVVKDLEKDFFTTVGKFDTYSIKNGLRTILVGLRILLSNSDEYSKYEKLLSRKE